MYAGKVLLNVLDSMTLRPKVAFFGVNFSSSSKSSATSPDTISPIPKDNLEGGTFFFLLVDAERPILGRFILSLSTPSPFSASITAVVVPVPVSSSVCSSSATILFLSEDFLKALWPMTDGLPLISVYAVS